MKQKDNNYSQIVPINISKMVECVTNLLDDITRQDNNRGIAVAIVDSYGELLVFVAHPYCYPLPRKIAIRKAYTAAILRRGTDLVEQEVKMGNLNLIALNDHNLIASTGGIPIEFDHKVIGGIGVSGLSAQEDLTIAKQLLTLFNDSGLFSKA